jgi:hypothetical protein
MPRTNAGIPAIVTRLENSKSVRRVGEKPLRPPVRAAGAVRAKAKRGAIVARPTPQETREIFIARRADEGEARKAAERMDRHLRAIERRLKLEDDDERVDLARILGVTA